MKILIKGLLIVTILVGVTVLMSACNKADFPDDPTVPDDPTPIETPTPTPTDAPTATPAVTPSPSPTAPASPSETIETSPSPTPSPTPTPSPSPSPSPSPTPPQGGGQGSGGGGGQSGGNQGGSNTQTPKPSDYVEVTGISFRTRDNSIALGETSEWLGQSAVISPGNATNQNVTYKSSDTSIATIADQRNGAITPVSLGTVTITATSYNGLTASYTMRVFDPNAPFDPYVYLNYAISYGESIGLTHTPTAGGDNPRASLGYDQPQRLNRGITDEQMKSSIRSRLNGHLEEGITSFRVYVIHNDDVGYIVPTKDTWILYIFR